MLPAGNIIREVMRPGGWNAAVKLAENFPINPLGFCEDHLSAARRWFFYCTDEFSAAHWRDSTALVPYGCGLRAVQKNASNSAGKATLPEAF